MHPFEQESGVEGTGLQDLLTYLPAFRVLVCRSCQFAVQPSALSSHLLRHQIYRSERRQLLSKFQKLQLWEPEAVPTPPTSISPIQELPVYKGYKCVEAGCEHACVAQKRMNQHWSDHHHEPDSRNVKSRPVLLQTFFRGNKIRYFEVSSTSTTPTPDSDDVSPASTRSPHGAEAPGFLNTFGLRDSVDRSKNIALRSKTPSLPPQPTARLDMDVLRLLHNYSTSTAFIIGRGGETHDFWSVKIPQEAFNHPFLMMGILGVSASHLALSCLNTNLHQIRELRDTALHYQSLALPLYRTEMNNPSPESANALIAFARIICIQRCALDQVDDKFSPSRFTVDGDDQASSHSSLTIHHYEPSTLPLIKGILLLKGHLDALLALQPVLPPDSGFLLSPEIRAGLEGKAPQHRSASAPSSDIVSHSLSTKCHLPLALQQVLRRLPELIARSIVNAQTSSDSRNFVPHLSDETQMSVISEMTTVTEAAYAISYDHSPSPLAEMWNGIESCPRQATKEYLDMVEAGHPTALLINAFWILLIRRQEANYWFLKGQSTRLLKCILRNLNPQTEEYRVVERLLDLEV